MQRISIRTPGILVLLCLLTAALRLHHLDQQAIWVDELNSFPRDVALPFHEYTLISKLYNPDHTPLYFGLLFFHAKCFGNDPVTLRLLGVLLAVLAVPLVYALGRRLGGARPAIFVSLLYALSPHYIFHQQSIRPYALLSVLAIASIYTLIKTSETRRWRWLALHDLANLLMLLTHVTGLFLLVAEGFYVLTWWRGHRRQLLIWGATKPILIFFALSFLGYPGGDPFYLFPKMRDLWNHIAGDDALARNSELIIAHSGPFWERISGAGGFLLLLLNSVAIAWVAFDLWRSRRRELPDTPLPQITGEFRLLILSVTLVPATLLFLASYAMEPMFMPRYSLSSTLGMHLVLTAAVFSRCPGLLRLVLATLVMGLYVTQTAAMLRAETRTQWITVAERLERESKPGDVILVTALGEHFTNLDSGAQWLLMLALDDPSLPVMEARTVAAAAQNAASALAGHPERSAWIVVWRLFGGVPITGLEQAMSASGLDFDRVDYPAQLGLTLYRCTAGPALQAGNMPVVDLRPEWPASETLAAWQIAPKDDAERAAMEAAVYRVFDNPPPPSYGPMDYFRLGATIEEPILSILLLVRTLEMDPSFTLARVCLGILLIDQGREAEGRALLQEVLAGLPDGKPVIWETFQKTIQALADGDMASARRLTRVLLHRGDVTPPRLHEMQGFFVTEHGVDGGWPVGVYREVPAWLYPGRETPRLPD